MRGAYRQKTSEKVHKRYRDSSSDTEVDSDDSDDNNTRYKNNSRAIKALKSSGLKFSGAENEFPKEFLSDLKVIIADSGLKERYILKALHVILTDKALYRKPRKISRKI